MTDQDAHRQHRQLPTSPLCTEFLNRLYESRPGISPIRLHNFVRLVPLRRSNHENTSGPMESLLINVNQPNCLMGFFCGCLRHLGGLHAWLAEAEL